MALIVGTDKDDNLFTQPFIIDTNIVRALGGNDLVRITNRDWYQAIGDRFDPDRYQVFRAANVDTVDLGAGDDLLIAGGGNDTLIGGTGYDIISYAEYYFAYLDFLEREVGEAYERGDQGVVVDLIAGTAMFSGATLESNLFPDERIFFNNVGIFSQTLTGFEAVIGTAYNDRISGTNRTDLTEVFDGYFGNDTINGRGGYDVASFHNTGGVVGDLNLMTVVGITEQQPAFNGGTFTVNDFTVRLLGIEGLYGSQDDDQLFGNSGDNLFHGRRGNNQINGRGGFDTVAYSFGTFGNKQVAGYSFNVENDMSSGVTINLETGVAVRLASSINHTDTLTSIEGVIGSIRDDHITGNTGGNTLDGVEGNDTIFGGLGSDELHGGADNDSLVGGAGNDVLTGGSSTAIVYDEDGILEEPAGVDTLDGGAGLDTVDYTMDGGRRGVTVSLLTGVATDSYALRDRIIGVENVTGTGLADRITGNTGVNILTGNAGNDVITGGGGRDSILGGAGDDTLRGGTARDAIEGGIGHDSLFGLDGNDSLEGEAGNDVIDAGTGDDTIEGGANDDSLLGGDGRDDIKGGDGKDTIAGGAGINVMDGEAGDDSVTGGVTVDILLGGGGNDTLRGGANAAGGADCLSGEAGNDTLYGESDFDFMLGGAGADRLFGGTGDDVLAGDSGTKVTGLIERAGREADYDGEIEVVAAGSDTLDGGAGYDTADYLFSATAIRASLRQGTATGEGVDRLIGIEGLIGSRFDDVLEGNDDNNALAGGKGNDTLRGLGGNDSIIGSAGADQIDGGAGLDTLFYDSIVKLALRAERISINAFRLETILGTTGEARGDTYVNVERFEGSDAGDSISMTGDAALNADGGSGADTLSGGNGRDRLSGGAGSDMLTGGAGADIFVFATPVVAGNADMITDFGTGDRIALENAVFIGIGGAGGLSADAFHLGRTASDAEDRILYDRARGELFYDRDGRGGTAAILFAQLDNGTLLGAGNFLVI